MMDDAIHEASRLLSSLRSMRTEDAVGEAELLLCTLEHDPVTNVLEFASDALEHIEAHLPDGTLAELVRNRLKSLVGMVLAIRDKTDEAGTADRAIPV
ncbi:hypothetical protein KG088_14970 [Halomonas sp. TRM85114]|uniref:hypothetical protein n=1 Tax=Halomonas jincaotanensis TaxID=2810616 RepID=UPI001BD6D28C|nr:hypothetical protein [Halomonas jincaotanensis]MBS9404928.1 hypothetical protein [Halomonas jincaotanensis]